MRALGVTFGFLALLPPLAAAEVNVTTNGSRVTIHARQAPLSAVLAQVAQATGMKLEFEGGRPNNLLTLSLVDEPLASAVGRVLEGAGVDFALSLDPSQQRVVSLLLLGRSPAVAAAGRPAPPRPLIRPAEAGTPELPFENLDDPGAEEPEGAPQPVEQMLSPVTPNTAPPGAAATPVPGALPAPPTAGPTPAPGLPTYQPFNQPAPQPLGQRPTQLFPQLSPAPTPPTPGSRIPAPAPSPTPGSNPDN